MDEQNSAQIRAGRAAIAEAKQNHEENEKAASAERVATRGFPFVARDKGELMAVNQYVNDQQEVVIQTEDGHEYVRDENSGDWVEANGVDPEPEVDPDPTPEPEAPEAPESDEGEQEGGEAE